MKFYKDRAAQLSVGKAGHLQGSKDPKKKQIPLERETQRQIR